MRPRRAYLTLNGETLSVAEWSKRTRLKPVTIHMRLIAGWSVSETLTTPADPMTLMHAGESRTLREWSQLTGLSANAIYGRLNLGWSIADALTVPIGSRRRRKPGVVSDFSRLSATDEPRHARDFSQLETTQ